MGDRLTTGQWMTTDAPLISANGLYAAYLQDDANLVLCYTTNGAADLSRPYWSAFANAAAAVGGPRTGPPYYAVMQADGNFVLYNGPNPGNQGPPYWATRTNRAQDQFTIIMQNDANFVVYDGTGQPIWASNTEQQPEPVSAASSTPRPPRPPRPPRRPWRRNRPKRPSRAITTQAVSLRTKACNTRSWACRSATPTTSRT